MEGFFINIIKWHYLCVTGTEHSDFLESKACFADTTSSSKKISPLSSVKAGLSASESPDLYRISVHLE